MSHIMPAQDKTRDELQGVARTEAHESNEEN